MEQTKNLGAELKAQLEYISSFELRQLQLRFKAFVYKLVKFEFWPWWALFIPLLPVYLISMIRTGRLLYFTTTNPSIPLGGFFGEDKTDIMKHIRSEYKARSILVRAGTFTPDLPEQYNLSFPLIVKPNVGERGNQVFRVHSINQLAKYSSQGFDFIIQEYIDLPIEVGLLYSKLPNEERGKISSLTIKKFMEVEGNGHSTIIELMEDHERHFMYRETLLKKFGESMMRVPGRGERVVVHKIGNHCLGTQFIDGAEFISPELTEAVANIVADYKGLDYGRLDLKVASLNDLRKGKGLKLFEINGISGEPAHMYDQPTVFRAWSILYWHWFRFLKISIQNIKKGVKTTPLNHFIKQVYGHFMT